jgi:hypothetical protein
LLVIGPIGSRKAYTTFFSEKGRIAVSCGCYCGSIDQFEKKVICVHEEGIYKIQYELAIKMARNTLKVK